MKTNILIAAYIVLVIIFIYMVSSIVQTRHVGATGTHDNVSLRVTITEDHPASATHVPVGGTGADWLRRKVLQSSIHPLDMQCPYQVYLPVVRSGLTRESVEPSGSVGEVVSRSIGQLDPAKTSLCGR